MYEFEFEEPIAFPSMYFDAALATELPLPEQILKGNVTGCLPEHVDLILQSDSVARIFGFELALPGLVKDELGKNAYLCGLSSVISLDIAQNSIGSSGTFLEKYTAQNMAHDYIVDFGIEGLYGDMSHYSDDQVDELREFLGDRKNEILEIGWKGLKSVVGAEDYVDRAFARHVGSQNLDFASHKNAYISAAGMLFSVLHVEYTKDLAALEASSTELDFSLFFPED